MLNIENIFQSVVTISNEYFFRMEIDMILRIC